jgi:hypothetical protein
MNRMKLARLWVEARTGKMLHEEQTVCTKPSGKKVHGICKQLQVVSQD